MTRRGCLGTMFVRMLLATVLSLWASTAAASPSLAEGDVTGFVVLTPKALQAKDNTFVGTVTMVNGTTQPLTITVTAALFDAEGNAVPTSIDLKSEKAVIKAGDSSQFSITASRAGSGTLIVHARDVTNAVIAISEQRLATASTPTPVAAVKEWAVIDDKWQGGTHSQIPLSESCNPAWEGGKAALAKAGTSIEVMATCNGKYLDLVTPEMEPGVYKGVLDLSSDVKVAITVTRSRPIMLAGILAMLGAALALIANVHLKLMQPIRSRRNRQDTANASFQAAKTLQRDKVPSLPVEVVAAIDFASPREAVGLADLETSYGKKFWRGHFWRNLVATLPTEKLTAVAIDLDSIENDANLVDRMIANLVELDKVRKSFAPDQTPTSAKYPLWGSAAAFFEKDWIFRGEPSLTSIAGHAKILSALSKLEPARNDLAAIYDELWDPSQRTAALMAYQTIAQIESEIGAADDAAPALADRIDKESREVQATIAALKAIPKQPQAVNTGRDSGSPVSSLLPLAPIKIGWPGYEQFKNALESIKPEVSASLDRAPNWLLFVVTLIAALLAGYAALYSGRAWGSELDIVAAFVYGATTIAASISLSTYFGNFVKIPMTAAAVSPSSAAGEVAGAVHSTTSRG